MIIEDKNEKPGTVELWTVAPGSVVQLDGGGRYWLVTDSRYGASDGEVYERYFIQEERNHSIIIIDLADGELEHFIGRVGAIVVEAKVVIE